MTLKPLQIVELRQTRCALRFGVGLCPASGSLFCYNTWATCESAATRAVYDDSGSIAWRFVANKPVPISQMASGDYSDPDNPEINLIPVNGLSVSTSKSQMNVAGILEGKSPFGIHATCSVSMDDFRWDDHDGDFYLASRVNLPERKFWETFLARNKLFANMELRIYDGYEGDAIAAMRQRLYVIDGIDGPSGGNVTIRGVDPLMLADDKTSLFPPAYVMSLYDAITVDATTATVVAQSEDQVSGTIGVTSGRHILLGSEIIGYDDYTVVSPGIYTLTGLTRGMGGSVAAAGSTGAKVGRVGHFKDTLIVRAARYLLVSWTPLSAAMINDAVWDYERDGWLSTGRCNTFIITPTAVKDLMGEICQQGCFAVWWDEYDQLVNMQAVRPPVGAVPVLNDTTSILADSAVLTMAPESRLTRVLVYRDVIDATRTGRANFRVVDGVIEGDGELPQAGGEPKTLEVLARWVSTEAQAYQVISRILLRYRAIPKMLSIKVSSKDREIGIGDVLDITSRVVVDSEGRALETRWQVTSWAEVIPGQTYQFDMQAFDLDGLYANWMDNATPTYLSASAEEKATGAFWSDSAGLMSDGSPGYRWQ